VPYGVGRLSARNDETVAVGGVCDLQREGGRKKRDEEREREKGRGKEGDGDLSEKRGERGRKKTRSKGRRKEREGESYLCSGLPAACRNTEPRRGPRPCATLVVAVVVRKVVAACSAGRSCTTARMFRAPLLAAVGERLLNRFVREARSETAARKRYRLRGRTRRALALRWESEKHAPPLSWESEKHAPSLSFPPALLRARRCASSGGSRRTPADIKRRRENEAAWWENEAACRGNEAASRESKQESWLQKGKVGKWPEKGNV
jgi:hypothetical protein